MHNTFHFNMIILQKSGSALTTPHASCTSIPTPTSSRRVSPTASLHIKRLQSNLSNLPLGWCSQLQLVNSKLQLCKLTPTPCTHSQPVHISHCVVINPDFSWDIFVNGHHIQENNSILSDIPGALTDRRTVMQLISRLESAHICHGYPKREYVDMANSRKGVFRDKASEVKARVDATNPVTMRGEVYQSTIRTVDCALLTESPLCSKCREYGPVLRSTFSRWSEKAKNDSVEASKFTNNRYLTSPQKSTKLKQLQDRVSQGRREISVLLEKIRRLTSSSGIELEPSFHQDLLSIM